MKITVFTDGACSGNGSKNAIGGIGIYHPDKELTDVSEPFLLQPITNQRAELYAIYYALDRIHYFIPDIKEILVVSDSNYSIKTLTEWRFNKNGKIQTGKALNMDIINPLIDMLDVLLKGVTVKFKHVNSHTGKKDKLSLGNDMADKLATRGKDKAKLFRSTKTRKRGEKGKKIETGSYNDTGSNVSSILGSDISSSYDNSNDVVVLKKVRKKKNRFSVDTSVKSTKSRKSGKKV